LVAATTKDTVTPTTKHANTEPGASHRLRDAANVRHNVRSVLKKADERHHRDASN
jgi:hypothetical protein